MDAWDKAAVIEWFKAHRGQEIVIRMEGTAVRIEGQARGVERLDACSTEIAETEMESLHQDIETTVSFHETTLGIHLIAFRPESRTVAVSLPASIPYDKLMLDTVDALAKDGKKEGEEAEEPDFSPYELLH
jgi:hypothetical protein